MKCLIISGGDYYIPNSANSYDYIIVCDKGLEYAKKDNIRIDLLLGDFDSYHNELDTSLNIERFKVEKDDTDTMLAIKDALAKGYLDITICSCFGGRLDHLFANIQSAAYIASHGGTCTMISQDTYLYAYNGGEIILDKMDNYSLSLFALTDEVTNLSIKGTKYEVENATLTSDFPLGVSNYWLSDKATISFDTGILAIICSSKAHEL